MNENEKKAWVKVVAGIVLMIAGGVGLGLRKVIKPLWAKITVTVASLAACFLGFYLFVDGVSTIAMGTIGQMQLRKADVTAIVEGKAPIPTETQTSTFPGPNFFEYSLNVAKAVDPTFKAVRRIRYECKDGSESFTVYMTKFGIFGIPSKSVTCDDGSKLVDYDPSKNFVIELSKS